MGCKSYDMKWKSGVESKRRTGNGMNAQVEVGRSTLLATSLFMRSSSISKSIRIVNYDATVSRVTRGINSKGKAFRY